MPSKAILPHGAAAEAGAVEFNENARAVPIKKIRDFVAPVIFIGRL